MLKNRLILLIVLMVSVQINPEIPENFRYRRNIDTGNKSGFAEIELDGSIYKNSETSFPDVRIYNSLNEEIPYYIKSGDLNEVAENEQYQTWKTEEKYNSKTDLTVLSYQIIEQSDFKINKLKFFFGDEEFSKQVDVYARNENSDWAYIKKDSLYKIKNLVKDDINLEAVYEYRFYKIEFTGKPSDFKNSDMEASFDNSIIIKSDFIKTVTAGYNYSQKDNFSEIRIPNDDNFYVKKIKINSTGFFSRTYDVYRENDVFLQSGQLNKASFNDTDIDETEIVFDTPVNSDILLVLDNKNDSPLKISSVELSVISYRLIFNADASQKYFIYYGKENMNLPQYDILKFKEQIDKEVHFTANMSVPEMLKIKEDKSSPVYKYIFNGLIVLVSVVLVVIISMRLKPVK
ncbi:MAG: hypothetical protein JW982_14080 [Spirochaetes bacterium]|nr:hypothetical protein [Spirochaetota bacterium]